MKSMMFLMLGLTFFAATASAQAAERIFCASEDGRYTVQFNLDQAIATDLTFKDGERVMARYDSVKAETSRVFKVFFYEFKLGGIRYFDLERKQNADSFSGAFLLGSNPFRFDVAVTCVAGVR